MTDMKKEKKQPMRSCVVCREKFIKRDLLRIVRGTDGKIRLDPTGKLPGRGAYICRNPQCLEKFLKRPSLERVFKQQIPKEDIETIRAEVRSLQAKLNTDAENTDQSGENNMN